MESNFEKLNNKYLKQEISLSGVRSIEYYKKIAENYAELEGSIVVLSDMHYNKSYLYYGEFAKTLGLPPCNNIDDIWEKDIMDHFHPEDLEQKFIQELLFLNFIRHKPKAKRNGYCLMQPIRMRNENGKWYSVIHKVLYIPEDKGNLWLSFCLYSPIEGLENQTCFILETATGVRHLLSELEGKNILSEREKEILRCINLGFSSKKIADKLFISVNTVSRHRQNIMKKLQANGSIEACNIAQRLQLL